MNKHGLVGMLLIVIGVFLLAYSVVYGEGKVMILLIIPVFYGNDIFAFIGVLSLMGGIFLLFLSYAENMAGRIEPGAKGRKAQKPAVPTKKLRAGGVVLIGPIPIIMGSDMKMAVIAMILAIVLIMAAILLFLVVL